MAIRKITLTGLALAVTLLLMLSACDFTFIFGSVHPEAGINFSLEWRDNSTDVPHLYMTYPVGDTTDALGAPTFNEPYLAPTDGGDLGFVPIDIGSGVPDEEIDTRGAVYYGNLQSGDSVSDIPAVQMIDSEDDFETILVRGFPFTSNSTFESTSGGGVTGLAAGYYTWVGVMEVYAYATTGQLEYTDGDGVNAVLNVFKTDGSGNEDVLAVYELPANTDLKGASIVRINCFYDDNDNEIYQLVPDIRVIQSTTQIRSVAPGAVIDENGIITVRMPVAE